MMPQLDLFGVPPPRPRAVTVSPLEGITEPRSLLPRRPIAWERLVEHAGPLPILLMASSHWTGVVVETLSTAEGLRFLCADGQTQEHAPQEEHRRVIIYYTPGALADLCRRAPLVLIAEGTDCLTARPWC